MTPPSAARPPPHFVGRNGNTKPVAERGNLAQRLGTKKSKGNAMTAPFDFAPLLAPGTPAPADKWNGFPKYNFVGGHNDADNVPVEALVEAATTVLRREGPTLATYGLNSGP